MGLPTYGLARFGHKVKVQHSLAVVRANVEREKRRTKSAQAERVGRVGCSVRSGSLAPSPACPTDGRTDGRTVRSWQFLQRNANRNALARSRAPLPAERREGGREGGRVKMPLPSLHSVDQ